MLAPITQGGFGCQGLRNDCDSTMQRATGRLERLGSQLPGPRGHNLRALRRRTRGAIPADPMIRPALLRLRGPWKPCPDPARHEERRRHAHGELLAILQPKSHGWGSRWPVASPPSVRPKSSPPERGALTDERPCGQCLSRTSQFSMPRERGVRPRTRPEE